MFQQREINEDIEPFGKANRNKDTDKEWDKELLRIREETDKGSHTEAEEHCRGPNIGN